MDLDDDADDGAVDGATRTARRDFLRSGARLAAAAAITTALGGGIGAGVARAASGSIVGELGGLGQFEIISYSWGTPTGGGTKSLAKVHDVSFTKDVDGLSAALSLAVASGQQFATASITVPGKGTRVTRYVMSDVLVTADSPGPVDANGNATESITLHFASVKTVHR